jgi:hypothetical protein
MLPSATTNHSSRSSLTQLCEDGEHAAVGVRRLGYFPADSDTLPLGSLGVTAGIYGVGFVLVTIGHRVGAKRCSRAVDLHPVT